MWKTLKLLIFLWQPVVLLQRWTTVRLQQQENKLIIDLPKQRLDKNEN